MKLKLFYLLAALAVFLAFPGTRTALADDAKLQATAEKVFKLAQQGKFLEAEQPINDLLANTNDTSFPRNEALAFRGYLRAENGRFQDAATDFQDVINTDPSEHTFWFLLMPLLIENGDLAEYRKHCTAMLHRFSDTTNAPVAERTAKCCLIMPDAVSPDDLKLACKVADKSVALAKKGEWKPWRLMTQGLGEYRLAHYSKCAATMEEALKEIPKMRDGSRDSCQADIYFVSAMAHQQLKLPDEALNAFKHGKVIVLSKLPKLDSKDLTPGWVDVLTTYIIMNEAKTTVAGTAAEDKK